MTDTLPREADNVANVQPVVPQSISEKSLLQTVKIITYSPTAIDRFLRNVLES